MPYKSPVNNRTPRNIAVEYSAPATFQGGDSMYNAAAGLPIAKVAGMPKDNVGPTFGRAQAPVEPTPFTNLKSAPGGQE